jgi:outer membrane receptor protein involved in Fe transport
MQIIRWLLLIILFFPVQFVFAETTGKLTGIITDAATGEGLAGVNVVIEGTTLGASSDLDGYYMSINIPPGKYDVSFYYVGYATVKVTNLVISIDRTTRQNISMNPETLTSETIVVEAVRPAIEFDRTHSAAIVNTETIDLMPVTELEEVIALQPSVVRSGGELHFRGGRSREVAYLVDGIPVSNSYSQDGGNNITVENAMVEEIEVISGTFNAEYGWAQSGVVNIVTKRVTDRFRGTLQIYAGEWLSNKTDIYLGVDDYNPLAEKDVQFTLSGPILSQKLGLLVSGRYNNKESLGWYERRYNAADGWKIAAYERWFKEHSPDEFASTQGIFIPDSLKTGDLSHGPLENSYSTSITAKLTYIASSTVNINYQAFGFFLESQGGSTSRRYQPDETSMSRDWSHSHFLSLKHFPTKNFFYNVAFSYQYNDGESFYRKDNKVARYPGDEGIQPIGSSADGFSLGNTSGFYTGKKGKDFREMFLVKGDLNWQADRYNFIKAGFEFRHHRINTYSWGYRETQEWQNLKWPNQSDLSGADHEFGEYWNRLIYYWENWEEINDAERYVAYADSEFTLWRDYTIQPEEYSLYIQDKIEMGDIIVNAGLRFDAFIPNEKYPVQLRTESYNLGAEENLAEASVKYQLSPRIGLSFPISSTGAFHASYGHFFQMPSFQYLYNEPLIVMNKFQLEGRTLGNTNLKPEKTVAYEIGIQQGITQTIAVDITAYYKDFKNLLGIERVTTIDAVGYDRYINRDYGNTKGVSIAVTKRGGLISGGLNYTYAYANGSSSDPNTLYLIETATRIGGEEVQFTERKILPLDWDQRQTLNMFLNIAKRDDWSVGLVGFLNSGLPYSPTFIERFDIAEREYRNRDNKPIRWNVDLKAIKFFTWSGYRLALFLKVDNLFDHLNEESVYSSTGRAGQNGRLPEDELLEREKLEQEGHFTLGEVDNEPGYYSSPRKIQIGLEFRF